MATILIENNGPEAIVVAQHVRNASTEFTTPKAFLNPGDSIILDVSATETILINQITISTTLSGGDLTTTLNTTTSSLSMNLGDTPAPPAAPAPPPDPITLGAPDDLCNKIYQWDGGCLTVQEL